MFFWMIRESMCDTYGNSNVSFCRLHGAKTVSATIAPGMAVTVVVKNNRANVVSKQGVLNRRPLRTVDQVLAVLNDVNLQSKSVRARELTALGGLENNEAA